MLSRVVRYKLYRVCSVFPYILPTGYRQNFPLRRIALLSRSVTWVLGCCKFDALIYGRKVIWQIAGAAKHIAAAVFLLLLPSYSLCLTCSLGNTPSMPINCRLFSHQLSFDDPQRGSAVKLNEDERGRTLLSCQLTNCWPAPTPLSPSSLLSTSKLPQKNTRTTFWCPPTQILWADLELMKAISTWECESKGKLSHFQAENLFIDMICLILDCGRFIAIDWYIFICFLIS